jgi:hypothetical protein
MHNKPAREALDRYHANYPKDTVFAAKTRLLQSIWRENKGLDYNIDKKYGNYLTDTDAKLKKNFITDRIGNLVQEEIKNKEKVIGQPRIWNNLLSSQPLAFNLFGELKLEEGLKTATKVFRELFPNQVKKVTAIEFEWSPGRRNPKYTNDRSAFDVFVEYDSIAGKKCFYGIEIKYAEHMDDQPARLREEYDKVSNEMGIYKSESLDDLRNTSLQQLWRDHLLVGSMFKSNDAYDRGDFIILYPKGNTECGELIDKYVKTFKSDDNYFIPLTLELFYKVLSNNLKDDWVNEFNKRYLDFDKIK